MTVEVALVISGLSLAFGIYLGVSNMKRFERVEAQKEAAQLTTVMVKLEHIGDGVVEIKNEMTNIKYDIKENGERLVKVEESAKSAHRRLDGLEKYQLRGGGSE